MSNRFHLAIEAGELSNTVKFYTDVLGCQLDMSEEGKWQDVDFWGNELTLHQSKPRNSDSLERHRHSVDMGDVIVPHLGIHLPLDEYQRVKASVASSVGFVDKPYIRFEDTTISRKRSLLKTPTLMFLRLRVWSNLETNKPLKFNLN